jgi:hypothetical protein
MSTIINLHAFEPVPRGFAVKVLNQTAKSNYRLIKKKIISLYDCYYKTTDNRFIVSLLIIKCLKSVRLSVFDIHIIISFLTSPLINGSKQSLTRNISYKRSANTGKSSGSE